MGERAYRRFATDGTAPSIAHVLRGPPDVVTIRNRLTFGQARLPLSKPSAASVINMLASGHWLRYGGQRGTNYVYSL
jgi:hypothetical protein